MSESQILDEEDDYLSMAINEPTHTRYESSAQRCARKKREAEARGHPKSKAEKVKEDSMALSQALSTQLDNSNKGFKMLQKLGYKSGNPLGKPGGSEDNTARLEPIAIDFKNDRAGIGSLSQKKRKVSAERERRITRSKADQDDFRIRKAKEKENLRNEALWQEGLRVFETLEQESVRQRSIVEADGVESDAVRERMSRYFQHHLDRQRDSDAYGKLRNPLDQEVSLVKSNAHLVSEESEDPDSDGVVGYEGDEVLSDSLDVKDQLDLITGYLREEHHYCFWCKHRYNDSNMEGCPGAEEADHD